jgi:LacI family transcriptional regulator
MKKKVSIKDVAHAVGVSTALVSYVLNNKEKEARVGKEIAEVIRNTAKKLDYQPNHIAKSLKSGKSHTIGLIVADISNPFFANISRTIEDEAKKNNYTVIIGSSDENPDKSWDLINVLIKRQVDGFIIVPTENSEKQIQYLDEQNIPFVLIDRYFPGIPANYVVTDNYQASYDAVLHLIKNKRKKIGMIAYKSNLVHMKERKRGYTEALKDNKLLTKVSLVREVSFNNINEDVDKSLTELLSSKFHIDALFFATNTLAMQGLKFLIRKKYKIPEDVAVVCFDESDVFDFFNFPLAFVSQPLEKVAKEAVQMLVNQIYDNDSSKSEVSISSTLVVKKPGV